MKEIALLIPCYNEAKRLNIASFRIFIEEHKDLIDFYFVDDGSEDETSSILLKNLVDNQETFLVRLENNLGKGNALREGFLQIKNKEYRFFGFMDADLDIPLKQILKLYNRIKHGSYSIAISNRDLFNEFNILRLRSIGSVVMVTIANQIIGLNPNLKDTQCGCKLFNRELLDIFFKEEFISEWLFDIELFLRLKKYITDARKYIHEVNLNNLSKTQNSNFKFSQNLKIFKQLYLINKYYN